LRFGLPIEANAAGIYTRNIFQKFAKEMFMAGAFGSRSKDGGSGYLVYLLNLTEGNQNFSQFNVTMTSDDRVYACDCKMFEHTGIPCRHIIKVMWQIYRF
jgi:hypothetical protein